MTYPTADRKAAAALGAALRRAGYTEHAVLDVLGDDAYSHDRDDLPLDERRLPPTPLGAVIALLFLQLPVARERLAAVLGERGVAALGAVGIAEVGEEVRVRARILPVGDLLVASDDYPRDDGEDPPDYVAAYTSTSRLCDCLTPRVRGVRALDVGTGSGVQALLAARHAASVVATDVNPRALAFTELNASLNGFTNVEVRRGSLFEAVAGERFDLITCNAPYVVSPENRWAYRDSGLEGDEITRRVVLAAADHLAEGGHATLLGSWVGASEEAADERPLAWARTLRGCDTWILSVWESDPLEHASTWNRQLAGKHERFAAALDSWTRYLAELGAGWVSEGAILLHRRPGRRHGARVDGIDDETLEAAGEQVRRAFEARARLAALARAEELLDARPALAMRVQLERELAPRRSGNAPAGARVQLLDGTGSTVETTGAALELVPVLDGRSTLRRLLARSSPAVRREALRLCRELAELGAVRL
ncbi:MAG TPA: methyltransferase [Gaiellaceae bacterium]|nr:methyltransferase [Gaiellaceae bacterium]